MAKHNYYMEPQQQVSLTSEGKRFWNFLFDRQVAEGNESRSLYRSNLIAFYRNSLSNTSENCPMEKDHGFIQWFFPLRQLGENKQAPVLSQNDYAIMQGINEVGEKMMEHFFLFINFMGVKMTEEGTFFKNNAGRWNNWINHNHNNKRITRVLKSMTDFGFSYVSQEFYGFLEQESRKHWEGNFQPFSDSARQSCQRFWATTVNPAPAPRYAPSQISYIPTPHANYVPAPYPYTPAQVNYASPPQPAIQAPSWVNKVSPAPAGGIPEPYAVTKGATGLNQCHFYTEADARAFADHMVTLGVTNPSGGAKKPVQGQNGFFVRLTDDEYDTYKADKKVPDLMPLAPQVNYAPAPQASHVSQVAGGRQRGGQKGCCAVM